MTTATAAETLKEHQAEAREQVRRAILAGESGGAIVTRAMRALMPSDEVGAMESEAEAIRAKLAELGDEPPELANVGDVVTAAAKAAKDLKKLHTQLADCLARAEAARDGAHRLADRLQRRDMILRKLQRGADTGSFADSPELAAMVAEVQAQLDAWREEARAGTRAAGQIVEPWNALVAAVRSARIPSMYL